MATASTTMTMQHRLDGMVEGAGLARGEAAVDQVAQAHAHRQHGARQRAPAPAARRDVRAIGPR